MSPSCWSNRTSKRSRGVGVGSARQVDEIRASPPARGLRPLEPLRLLRVECAANLARPSASRMALEVTLRASEALSFIRRGPERAVVGEVVRRGEHLARHGAREGRRREGRRHRRAGQPGARRAHSSTLLGPGLRHVMTEVAFGGGGGSDVGNERCVVAAARRAQGAQADIPIVLEGPAGRRPCDVAGDIGIARHPANVRGQAALGAVLAVHELALGAECRGGEIGRLRATPADIADRGCRAQRDSDYRGHGDFPAPNGSRHGIASHDKKSPPCALSTGYAGVATSRVPAP